jgi:hypothetical protein
MGKECPFCGEITKRLWAHVYISHVPIGLTCWCDGIAGFHWKEFKDHCVERGGMVAHYLECSLGCSENEGK